MERIANLAVSGKFHVFNYAPFLFRSKVLNQLYCSHRLGSFRRFNLDPERTKNYPLKEYMVQLHGRVFPNTLYDAAMPLYTALWSTSVQRGWMPARLLHLLSQGGSRGAIRKARTDGATVIFEAVNTHPRNRLRVLNEEVARWGCGNVRAQLHARELLIIEEAESADYVLCPSSAVMDPYIAHTLFQQRGVAAIGNPIGIDDQYVQVIHPRTMLPARAAARRWKSGPDSIAACD